MIRTLLKPFSFLPALILMYTIYTFSAQPADVSSQLSFKVSCKIVETADYIFDAELDPWEVEYWATRIHFITRKLAHMTIYFALAVAVSFPLYVYGIRGIWLMLLAGLICVGFAYGDEYHQSFVEGRGPSTKDVAIDAFGVFWGIILVRIVGWTGRKTIFRPHRKKEKRKNPMPYTQPVPPQNQMPYTQPVPPQNPMPYMQQITPPYTQSVPPYNPSPDREVYRYPYYQQMPPLSDTPPYGGQDNYASRENLHSPSEYPQHEYHPYKNSYPSENQTLHS